MDDETTQAQTTFAGLVQVLCGFTVVTAFANLIGWWFRIPFLIGFFPEVATMKPNTAVCVILLAAAILARSRSRVGLARWLSGVATLVAIATLVEYAFGLDLGMDQLLVRVPSEMAGGPLGRMSQGTAADIIATGIAVMMLDELPTLATTLIAGASLLSLSALVGFLFDAGPLLGFSPLRSMAVRTALCLFVLQLVVFVTRPNREPLRSLLRSMGQYRRGVGFLVLTCSLPLVLGIPIAVFYRHGVFEASFGFALLVVLLIGAQAAMVLQSSHSISVVEGRRAAAEHVRAALVEENTRQDAIVRESERKATESDAQYRLITNALPALISYIDRDLRYLRVNKTYTAWFGLEIAEVEGKTIHQILGRAADEVEGHLQRAMENEPQQFETELETLQGKRTVSVSHTPDCDPLGRVRGVIVQSLDVTAQRREEDSLRRTEKLAAVGKLASSIAHEINNPLEAVTNLLFLAKGSADLQEAREYLSTAESELARVSAIASQTLRFHKQATGSTRSDPIELLDSTLAIYRPRLAEGIRLERRFRPTKALPCFEGEIRQVLNNLIGNALDAMPQGGSLHIRVQETRSLTLEDSGIVFTIADTGSGMSSKTAESIFEAFFTTKGVNGTGLGLWVSKEIIDRHGGSLKLRTSQQARSHGTVFRLFLPYRTPPR